MNALTKADRLELAMENCPCASGMLGRITAGDLEGDGPHASTYVCNSATHQAQAKEWAMLLTGLEPVYVPLGRPA